MAELEKVRVRDCECPNKPHNGEGDWVALAPHLSLEGGLAAEQDVYAANVESADETAISLNVQRRWALTFIRFGAKAWNLVDEHGDSVPFDVQAILDDYAIARPLADSAADLYAESVLRPFQVRLATRSPTGPTTATTSSRRRQTRKRSARSSPDTTAGSTPLAP